MSKLIVETVTDMPNSCDVCPFVHENDDLFSEDYRYLECGFPNMGMFVTDYIASRHPDCPIKGVLPEEHGDLIDRDELKVMKVYSHERHEYIVPVSYIDWEQAVIAAERKDDERTAD